MSEVLQLLADRYCERSTAIEGCLREPHLTDDARYGEDQRCPPCMARAELGIKLQPRKCENCLAPVTAEGVDENGGIRCPAPLHQPHLFYHEFGWRNTGT